MWQAAAWPFSRMGERMGLFDPQRDSAKAQRVWKRQPAGGLIGFGGSPASGASCVRLSGSMEGMAARSARE
jgi:hypothetical protein